MEAKLDSLQIKDDYLRRVLEGKEFLLFDGAFGTMMQRAGLTQNGENPDLLNLEAPEAITAIHRAYVEAGAMVATTNTFGANALKLGDAASVAEVYEAAARAARASGARYVAGDIGPTGALLEPMGLLSFELAYEVFAEQARAARDAGCDLIVVETMSDLREAKAAVLAATTETQLPVFVTMTFGEDGRTFLGTTPAIAAITLSSLGVAAVGMNCSLGPDELIPLVEQMAPRMRCPLMVQPNAGLPRVQDGETVYDLTSEQFARSVEKILDAGATIVGGCCGTDPSFIAAVRELIESRAVKSLPYEGAFCVTSAQEAVVLPQGKSQIAVIGERINPTGKKRLKEALRKAEYDYVVGEAFDQQKAGADILDVNAGLPDIDEPRVLADLVDVLQATITTPLQIDSSDPVAIEAAVRAYAGKPLVNSVNGKAENLAAVLPIVRKYGCSVVGLTLDEDGIPPTAEGRLAIAERIVEAAESYGIPRCDVAIDCLVMAAATNQEEIREILRAITMCKEKLGVRTVLGVSNVSFGMPQRPLLNATFLAAAFGAGLDLPILNPLSGRYRDAVAAFRVVNGQDEGAASFLEAYAGKVDPYDAAAQGQVIGDFASAGQASVQSDAQAAGGPEALGACPIPIAPPFALDAELVAELASCALAGRAGAVAKASERLLESHDPLALINEVFVPILDVVGRKYDAGEFFLPQLMASAEAVKAGFDVVRQRSQGEGGSSDRALPEKREIIVATVEGDIHDIGKNIVKMLLENYGFAIVDLGRDVPAERIVDEVLARKARLLVLSALMTTTVKAMERTIELLRQQAPSCAVMVGGAVLTEDYAAKIDADFYAKDAAEATRIATGYFDSL